MRLRKMGLSHSGTQDSAGDSTATWYHAGSRVPPATPRGLSDRSPRAMQHSPLAAHPASPMPAGQRGSAGCSPQCAGPPPTAPLPEHPPNFAMIYAFLGSLFDHVRSFS